MKDANFQKLMDAAHGFIKLGNIDRASSTFGKITGEYPQEFDGWWEWALFEIELEKQNRASLYPFQSERLENAKKLASPAQMEEIKRVLDEYDSFIKNKTKTSAIFFEKFKTPQEFSKYLTSKKIYLSFEDTVSEDKKSISSQYKEELIYKQEWKIEEYKYKDEQRITSFDVQNRLIILDSECTTTIYILGKYDSSRKSRTKRIFSVEEFNLDNNTLVLSEKKEEYYKSLRPDYKVEVFTLLPQSYAGGCYIATCVYGSYDCPEVWALRRFRDNVLAKTWFGRTFIKTYYAISPSLVNRFGNTAVFRSFWKGFLDRLVDKLKKKGIKDTIYYD